MQVHISGRDLPGRRFATYDNVHVGVQRGTEVVELRPGDAEAVDWTFDVKTVPGADGRCDLRGPYVHGRRGDRFLYLSFGSVDSNGGFTMFRRAKLMLDAVPQTVLAAASEPGARLVGRLGLTEPGGGPRCAAVRPPDIVWEMW